MIMHAYMKRNFSALVAVSIYAHIVRGVGEIP